MSHAEFSVDGPRSGKMAAAWAEGPPWYPIVIGERLQLPVHTPVIVALAGVGTEILAEIRRHPTRRLMWWWYQLGVWGGDGYGFLRTETIKLEKVWHEPVSDYSPVAFRPADATAWRHPLPEPLPPAFGPKRPDSLPGASDAAALDPPVDGARLRHDGTDDWPYPGLALGSLTVPASREECEARLLRAFRTSNSAAGGGLGHASRAICADIPREIVLMSCAINAAWWSVHPDADGGSYEAVRSGWTPAKRDLNDWVYALSWLNGIGTRALRVVTMRAADPPYSFRQIAEKIRGCKSHNTARALYDRAIDHAFSAALRMPTPSSERASGTTPHPRGSAQPNGGAT